MTEEERDAAQLRAYLEGQGAPPDPETGDVVGLFRTARGEAGERSTWGRIQARVGPPSALAWAGYLAATASVILLMLWPGGASEPQPPGATASQREAAMKALDPRSAPPAQRLAALHQAARAERTRLVAEISR